MNELIELVLKATIVTGAAWFLGIALRKRSPSLSHFVLALTFVSVLILPLMSRIMPTRNVLTLPETPVLTNANASEVGPVPLSESTAKPHRPIATAIPESATPFNTGRVLTLALWLAGAIAVACRALVGLVKLNGIRRQGSVPCAFDPAEWIPDDANPSRTEIRISTTPSPATALTWGIFQPVVLLPLESHMWSAQRLRAVVLHELAHVRRCDFASQMLAEAACAMYWFNPLVWLAARAMRADAELAADDAVLRSGMTPSAYAAELLQIAAELGRRPALASNAGVPAMSSPKIETRLQSILSPNARRRGVTTLHALVALCGSVLAISGISSMHATRASQGVRPESDSHEARNRAKMLALATTMYAYDYDGLFPYAQSTKAVQDLITPYLKSKEVFNSPTPGGRFVFNPNIGGVNVSIFKLVDPAQQVPKPANSASLSGAVPPGAVAAGPINLGTSTLAASTPMWIEEVPNASPVAVAFVDGHAKLVDLAGRAALAAERKKTFLRAKNSKPIVLGGAP